MTDDLEQVKHFLGMAVKLGISFNIGMGAIMTIALPLAEDKEMNTLRFLMTSSVNGVQFFIGSLIPPFIITVVINYLIIFVSGVDTADINWLMFSIITIIGSLTSCMLGLLIGIIAKSQVNANNIMMPFVLVLGMIPSFASMVESLSKVSKYLYTGIISDMVGAYTFGEPFNLDIQQILVLGISMVVIAFLFFYYYKKTILESD